VNTKNSAGALRHRRSEASRRAEQFVRWANTREDTLRKKLDPSCKREAVTPEMWETLFMYLANECRDTKLAPLFAPEAWSGTSAVTCNFLDSVLSVLSSIARQNENKESNPNPINLGALLGLHRELHRDGNVLRVRYAYPQVATLRDEFLELLQAIDATVIRRCEHPKCRRLFMARRKDQDACSPACAQRFRVMCAYSKQRENMGQPPKRRWHDLRSHEAPRTRH
jgi:hypothetical protein